jgi:competence protein ComEA
LPEGTRYEQALEAAGGVTSDGAKDYLNLADIISDGAKIYVPFLKDVEDQYGMSAEAQRKQESGEITTTSLLININTATAAQLQQLKGIGQVRAEAIVEYREANGAFQTIEDIMKVPGIKEGAFQKIKDEITVG